MKIFILSLLIFVLSGCSHNSPSREIASGLDEKTIYDEQCVGGCEY